ncbi:MAG: hypothetical protein IPN92_06240 [Chromatiaceae bacterium]|nr:hypothetical protein [Chromatiaceae bacterium]
MANALIASLVIFAVLAGWVWVQQRYAAFARQNPKLGPFRAPDGSCGGGCACKNGQCETRTP